MGLAPTYLGHWCQAEIFSIADCIFAEVVDDVGVINGSFAIAANSGKCAGRPRFCHCGKGTASTYLRFGHRDRDHNPAFSGRGGRTVGPIWAPIGTPSPRRSRQQIKGLFLLRAGLHFGADLHHCLEAASGLDCDQYRRTVLSQATRLRIPAAVRLKTKPSSCTASSSDPGDVHSLRNQWFARLCAGGEWIQTFSSVRDRQLVRALGPIDRRRGEPSEHSSASANH